MKGKRTAIFVLACLAAAIIAMFVALQVEPRGTVFSIMEAIQAIGVVLALWELIAYMTRKFETKRKLRSFLEIIDRIVTRVKAGR